MARDDPVPPAGADGPTFLGHPRGLAFLAFTEAWERFSFYGMIVLLMLYMVQELLTPAVMGSVFALGQFRAGLETLTGPLSNQAFASQIFGLYTGFVYFTPVFGGMLADRWLGQRRTVMLGALLMSAGHVLMAFYGTFLIALVLLVVGTGCLKGNISTQVGHLYPAEDESRRTRAFVIFSAAINVGALTGPLVCGILAQAYGWHAGFGACGVLMLLALATYASGQKYLAPDRKHTRNAVSPPRLTVADWRILAALVALMLLAIFPAVAYYQENDAVTLFVEQSVRRNLFGWIVPTPSFGSVDGFCCIAFVPVFIGLWRWLERRRAEPDDFGKIAIGYGLTALGSLAMILPAYWADSGSSVSIGWPLLHYALNAAGFIAYWPTLLALFSRAAPRAVNATMMGILFLSLFVADLLVGIVGGWWQLMSHARFFGLHVLFALVPALLTILLAGTLRNLLAPSMPQPDREAIA